MKVAYFFLLIMICFIASLASRNVQASDIPPRPNVLFIIADDTSQRMGAAYRCNWIKTPNIDRLASEGLVFDNAYVPTSKCAPCRACILTGRNPWQLEAAGNHQAIFPPKYKAFTEALAESGVHVGSLGKTWGPGRALTADDQPRNFALKPAPFSQFLAQRPKDKPFFFGSAVRTHIGPTKWTRV